MCRPQLRVVRTSDPPPPLEYASGEVLPRLHVVHRRRRRDSLLVGFFLVGSLLAGAVLMSIALGWIRL